LKIREVVHISFVRSPSAIRPPKGPAAHAIGLKLPVPALETKVPRGTADRP
jgi:hypothetical protein